MGYKVLAINPGSTSTKIGVYLDEEEIWSQNINHRADELADFTATIDQLSFRLEKIKDCLNAGQHQLAEFDAIVARGGLLKPLTGGTYRVNDRMLADLRQAKYGSHASNLGAVLARELADSINKTAFIVDPVVVDELMPIARVTGLPDMEKRSIFHALNQKAIARRLAKSVQRKVEELNLIVAHMGGGISIGCHQRGRVVEVNNALNGTGPFSPERAGTVQAENLVELIFGKQLTKEAVAKLLAGKGGLVAHLGTNDAREVEKMIQSGDGRAKVVYDAMIYQIAREIAAAAVPVQGEVDYIVLTGGMAYSQYLTEKLTSYVKFIAPVMIFPGEDELKALAEGAIRILAGEESCQEYL